MFESLTLRQARVCQRSAALRTSIRALCEDERCAFYNAWEPRIKDPDTYAALNWLFIAGAHHMYLGKWARGWCNFAVMLIGALLLFNGFGSGMAMILIIALIELPALIRSQIIVQEHNIRRGETVLRMLRSP